MCGWSSSESVTTASLMKAATLLWSRLCLLMVDVVELVQYRVSQARW